MSAASAQITSYNVMLLGSHVLSSRSRDITKQLKPGRRKTNINIRFFTKNPKKVEMTNNSIHGQRPPQIVIAGGRHSLLWPEAATVCCGWRPTYFVVVVGRHSLLWLEAATVCCGRRPPKFVVAGDRHSLLWPKGRHSLMWPEAAIVPCFRKPQDICSHRWLHNMRLLPIFRTELLDSSHIT